MGSREAAESREVSEDPAPSRMPHDAEPLDPGEAVVYGPAPEVWIGLPPEGPPVPTMTLPRRPFAEWEREVLERIGRASPS